MSTSDYCFNSAKVTQNSQYILRITISIMYIQGRFVARKQFNECNFPNQSTLFGVHCDYRCSKSYKVKYVLDVLVIYCINCQTSYLVSIKICNIIYCIYNAFHLFSDHFLFVPRLIFPKRSFPALNSKPASIPLNPLFANKTFGHFGVFLHLPLSLHRKLYISGKENT